MLYRTLTLQECPRFFRNLRQSPTWCRERLRDERYSQSLDAGTSICSVRFGVTTLRLDECNLLVLIKNEMFDRRRHARGTAQTKRCVRRAGGNFPVADSGGEMIFL